MLNIILWSQTPLLQFTNDIPLLCNSAVSYRLEGEIYERKERGYRWNKGYCKIYKIGILKVLVYLLSSTSSSAASLFSVK